MKPKLVHQEAMNYSLNAKKALTEGDHSTAFDLYKKAAELESQVADFYFDKPEIEPTRSIMIRSAAFMNLKAGLIENAKKYIFFGLLNSTDETIKEQLNDALELAVSLDNLSPKAASEEFNYLNLLRQRSIHYVIEPSNPFFGHSVSLGMIKDFSDNYLKSLKAFALSKLKKALNIKAEIEDSIAKDLDKLINPLITNSAYGSFKFSVANDFLQRDGEDKELVQLKSNVISKYHNEIFINPLSDTDIDTIKKNYDEEEVNDIFRPLVKIKSANSSYKVGYYDTDNFSKIYTGKIINKQKIKLITVKPLTQEDIGELESSIIHKRSSQSGKVTKKTIFKEHLKSYETEIKTNQIDPVNHAPLILNEEIIINMSFDSNTGFTFSFDDFRIQTTDIEFESAYKDFHSTFYKKLITIVNKADRNEEEEKDWAVIVKLIGNPDALKK